LNDFSDKNGIVRIDIYPSFAGAKDKPLYYDFDGHFTEKGHAAAAEAIFRGIKPLFNKAES
jgi:hypothetical protein